MWKILIVLFISSNAFAMGVSMVDNKFSAEHGEAFMATAPKEPETKAYLIAVQGPGMRVSDEKAARTISSISYPNKD